MEEKLFPHLLANQPGVVELTQKEYEDHFGIGQSGESGTGNKDAGQALGQDSAEQTKPQVSGEDRTKAEIIKEILSRGNEFNKGELSRKRKSELIDLL